MTRPAVHWAADYIGQPWVAGVSDCWHFARAVWAERFGIEVPVTGVDVTSALAGRRALRDGARAGWQAVQTPAEGDGVLMGIGTRPCHVGLWINPDATGGVLHSVEGAGVIYSPGLRVQGIGYVILGYYRRVQP